MKIEGYFRIPITSLVKPVSQPSESAQLKRFSAKTITATPLYVHMETPIHKYWNTISYWSPYILLDYQIHLSYSS